VSAVNIFWAENLCLTWFFAQNMYLYLCPTIQLDVLCFVFRQKETKTSKQQDPQAVYVTVTEQSAYDV
jgi:hypothetical protein